MNRPGHVAACGRKPTLIGVDDNVPDDGRRVPTTSDKSVDFPDPFGPRRATTPVRGQERETSHSARRPPLYVYETPDKRKEEMLSSCLEVNQ